MSHADDELDPPFATLDEHVSVRPPPPPPSRAPQWGELQLDSPREPAPGLPASGSMPAPARAPASVPVPASAPVAPAGEATSRPWGEIDLSGVSSNIGQPIELDDAAREERAREESALEEAPAAPVRAAPALPPGARAVVSTMLPRLPDGHVYYCDHCAVYVAPEDVRAMSASEGRVAVPICPTCRRFVRTEASAHVRPLHVVLLEAILWPFSRQMLPTWLGNTLVFWFFFSFAFVRLPFAAFGGLAVALGVLATYGAAILRSTARGDDQPPPPSEAIASWSVASAVIRHAAVMVLGSLPLCYVVFASAAGSWSPMQRTLLSLIGIVCFCLYVPAGQIVASSHETLFAALNPITPIRFAWRVGPRYLIACAILFAFALAHLFAVLLVMALAAVAFGGSGMMSVLLWALSVSCVVVLGVLIEARMLGLVVREHRFDLALV